MSFFSRPFSVKKAAPRKFTSRSQLKLPANEIQRELGAKIETIDIKVSDKRIFYDVENADWNTANAESVGTTVSSNAAQKIRKQVEILQEENNMLKLKVEVLLNLVAESVAELTSTGK